MVTLQKCEIDALSRDDLVCFVKKQIEKLKSVKTENEKLRTELAEIGKNLSVCEQKCSDVQKENFEKNEEVKLLNESANQASIPSECVLSDSENETIMNIAQLQNELTSVKNMLQEQSKKYEKQVNENERLIYTLAELRSLFDDQQAQLESYKEKRSVENVISLEMADFEKTIERLQKELKAVKNEKQELDTKLSSVTKEMEILYEEKASLSSNIMKFEDALEKETEIDLRDKEQKRLEGQLKDQVSARSEERDQLMIVISNNEKNIKDLQTSNSSLNRQLISLRSQHESLQKQLDDLSQEYSTFKVRAHYVLEQRKSEADQRGEGEMEILEGTIREQKKTIENLVNSTLNLQGELDSSSQHVITLATEVTNLQRQLDTVIESHRKELAEQSREFESRSASATKLNSELIMQLEANSAAHVQEKKNLLITARQERESLQEELERLHHALDEEVKRRTDMEKIQATMTAQNVAIQIQKPVTETPLLSSYLKRPSTLVTSAKEIRNDSNEIYKEKSLEEVIYGESEEDAVIDIWNQSESSMTLEETVQLEHTRELLNESESNNARLLEQTKVLKEEIRKMERNKERENHLSNTEYLKDIILKFIAPEKVTYERGQLIPVLATMLKLSSDEVNLLTRFVEGILFAKLKLLVQI
ncbi:unnamed protein product [Thelazia callipaeda]|uniref:GRIP domain-containing protein n=1 Tax=Thelazia callipaeda TaxID=103827 RepID=A0A0N5CV22_THECL|nr:unnamed protein product [Thelazia callipaeda]